MSEIINLPPPSFKGDASVEEAIKERRTIRSFSKEPLQLEVWAQILWAAQGTTITRDTMKRSAPSAGALYPLDIYLILGSNALTPPGVGIYHYMPEKHALQRLSSEDCLQRVAEASLNQLWMAEAPGMVLITAKYERIMDKYGKRGIRYADIEAGHVAQNCFLQAESLHLGAGIVGAFSDEDLKSVIPIPNGHAPLLILPIGRKIKQ